jgi:serine/threonine protein kinase
MAPILSPGSQIRDYVVVEHLATSPVASLYRARSPAGDVALKLYAGAATPPPGPAIAAQREVRHCAVARLLDVGELDDGFFIASEWIAGASLATLIERRLQWETIRRVVGAVGAGLGALHVRGVVHRDLKPSNVIVPARRGCAAVVVDASPALVERTAESAIGVTRAAAPYAAPERVAGMPVDGRADLYALGVILFEMLASRRVEDAERCGASIELSELDGAVPHAAKALCRWLLASDRDARVPNTHVLAVTIGAAAAELGALGGVTVDARSQS